jgi:hypothetical protein
MSQPEVNLWTLSDLCTPWCVHVVATLRIADRIAAGMNQIDDLAREAGCDPHALHSLLGHLVSKGMFEETASGQFALNDLARGLLDPIAQLSLDLEGLGGRFAYAWGTMLDYVRTRPGLPTRTRMPPEIASFDALIGPPGHARPTRVQITGGWEAVRTVADVGGMGAMLAEILRSMLTSAHLVDDLTVARSSEIFWRRASERVTTAGHSF